jgi:hypothetical protein
VSALELVYFNQYCLEVVDYLCEGVLGDAITGTIRYDTHAKLDCISFYLFLIESQA